VGQESNPGLPIFVLLNMKYQLANFVLAIRLIHGICCRDWKRNSLLDSDK
jgi:hypothetical protein